MRPEVGVQGQFNVRKRDVKHNDDAEMTREPEMVQAYRDTWELGLHSYLTYLRDRLLLARELLTPAGSIFVQISDENLHHVREVMDEVFGAENFCGIVAFAKTSGLSSKLLPSSCDYLLWYARDIALVKYQQLYEDRPATDEPSERYICVETPDGQVLDLSYAQKTGKVPIPEGRFLKSSDITSQDPVESLRYEITFGGRKFLPSPRRHWTTHEEGLNQLMVQNRVHAQGNNLWFKRYRSDFAYRPIGDVWLDVKTNAFGDPRFYVVQTGTAVIERCLLMTTDPGDLVLDPTCGSGTTVYVAEQWGRRWITIDTSRVPLALARQRLLTATFSYYELKDELLGPAGGFVYKRKQTKKGESAEAVVLNGNGGDTEKLVTTVFGPENGAVSERLVSEAAREACMKGYAHLYVIGFAIQPNARALIESSAELGGVPMTYIQATLDLLMGDLLKNMRSSQIFSVCGLPEVELRKLRKDGKTQYQVELLGLDVFDPITMENDHRKGDDVPAWLLDMNYNGNCFHVSQAFFPRTGAWDNLKNRSRVITKRRMEPSGRDDQRAV